MENIESTVAPPNGSSVHLASVDLLCRLENGLDKLRRLRKKGTVLERLDAATLMLVEVLGFTEEHLDGEALAHLNPRIQHIYDQTRGLDQQMGGNSWGGVSKLFSRSPDQDIEVNAAYHKLRDEYSRLFVQFFVKCVEKFSCPAAEKVSFLKTVDSFVNELGQVW